MPLKFELEEVRLLAANYSYNPYVKNNQNSNDNGSEVYPVKLNIKIGHSFKEETKNLKVRLRLNSDDKNLSFAFDVEYGGSFNIIDDAEGFEEEEIEKLARIWCSAIIYPYIRECISDLVRRGQDEPFFLPVLNFVNLYRDERKRKKQKRK